MFISITTNSMFKFFMFYQIVRYLISLFYYIYNLVQESELQIWSLRISSFQQIPAHNCVLVFLEHHQTIQYGEESLLA
jgi:hypothetical protein